MFFYQIHVTSERRGGTLLLDPRSDDIDVAEYAQRTVHIEIQLVHQLQMSVFLKKTETNFSSLHFRKNCPGSRGGDWSRSDRQSGRRERHPQCPRAAALSPFAPSTCSQQPPADPRQSSRCGSGLRAFFFGILQFFPFLFFVKNSPTTFLSDLHSALLLLTVHFSIFLILPRPLIVVVQQLLVVIIIHVLIALHLNFYL